MKRIVTGDNSDKKSSPAFVLRFSPIHTVGSVDERDVPQPGTPVAKDPPTASIAQQEPSAADHALGSPPTPGAVSTPGSVAGDLTASPAVKAPASVASSFLVHGLLSSEDSQGGKDDGQNDVEQLIFKGVHRKLGGGGGASTGTYELKNKLNEEDSRNERLDQEDIHPSFFHKIGEDVGGVAVGFAFDVLVTSGTIGVWMDVGWATGTGAVITRHWSGEFLFRYWT